MTYARKKFTSIFAAFGSISRIATYSVWYRLRSGILPHLTETNNTVQLIAHFALNMYFTLNAHFILNAQLIYNALLAHSVYLTPFKQ